MGKLKAVYLPKIDHLYYIFIYFYKNTIFSIYFSHFLFKNSIIWIKLSIEPNFGWAVLISVKRSITNNSWVSDKVKQAVTNRFSDSLEFKEQVTNKQVGIKN